MKDVPFSDLFSSFPGPGSSFIEIGGFPGTFAVYFRKYRGYQVSILDCFYAPSVIRGMERANSLAEGSIRTLKEDFLEFATDKRYDVVFSAGFIEHFLDLGLVLRKMCDLLKPGGTLFASVPNFRGINGLIQKMFDGSNYDAHNLEAMNTRRLEDICGSLGLQQFRAFYYGVPGIWLRGSARVNHLTKIMLGKLNTVMTYVPLTNRYFSPHVVLLARKTDDETRSCR